MTGPINVKIIHIGSEKCRSLGETDHMHNTLMTANNQGRLWQWKSVCFAEVTVVPSDRGNFSLLVHIHP